MNGGRGSWTKEQIRICFFHFAISFQLDVRSQVSRVLLLLKMFYFVALTACLVSLPQGRTEPRTGIRRYKPVIQVTEEIDINDITFTTSSPLYDRSSSHKVFNFHNGLKSDVKPISFKIPESPPSSIYPHVSYKDSYGASLPLDKTYSAAQPIAVSTVKYKPFKVYKAPSAHDEFKLHHKNKEQEKGNIVHFEPPTTFSVTSTQDTPKQYSTKVVPFPSQYLTAKGPTKATAFHGQDAKTFIPSPTFSPTVLAQINKETSEKFVPEVKKLSPEKKEVEWKKATKKPPYIKKSKKILNNPNIQTTKPPSEDYSEEISGQDTLYKDSPQSESFLSEISTLHQGGGSGNNLDGAPDALDLKTGERVEFQMYGMDGPQSYKFGYDTGKGENRHFRFEERDNTGKVKGHYGYLDEDGKMRIMKYEADPITGFHAGPVEISPEDN